VREIPYLHFYKVGKRSKAQPERQKKYLTIKICHPIRKPE